MEVPRDASLMMNKTVFIQSTYNPATKPYVSGWRFGAGRHVVGIDLTFLKVFFICL